MKSYLILMLAVGFIAGVQAQQTGIGGAGPAVVWRVPKYSITARAMQVREALETFAVAQGVPLVMSEAVSGQFSGNFNDIPAGEFLDRVTTMHNLVWYYDGASIFVFGARESVSTLIDLKYMKADEVKAMMRELGVEDARYPLKIAANGELIMVSGPPRYVTLVAEMIGKADRLREQRTFNEVEVRLFPLVHTWADTVNFTSKGVESSLKIRGVAELLQDIMAADGGVNMQDGTNDVNSADAQTANAATKGFRPLIRAENRLNAVLVRDVSTRMPIYEKLIQQLDRPQKLVEIGITTVELSKNDMLDWQLSLSVRGTHKDITAAAGQNAQNLFSPDALGGQGLAGAFTYLGRNIDVSASLMALRNKGKARNIAKTSIVTLNNLSAEMSDSQSYHAKVVGTEVASLEEVSAGTLLQVKPRIIEPPAGVTNAAEQVWLTIKLQDGGFETLTVDAMPMTRTSMIETQASLPIGDSLLLAGYLRDIEEEAGWGIPYLRDIPFIGWLFGGVSHHSETVQRFFILTPQIIDIPYYKATTQDVVTVQALRQRDIAEPLSLEDDIDRADAARKEREEELRESREIRREKEEDTLKRNRAERELRSEQRRDTREMENEDWQRDFIRRREEYRERIDVIKELREQAQEAEEERKEAEEERKEAEEERKEAEAANKEEQEEQ